MKEHMRIATGDTGLQRVATISGIVTININEIAAALQPPMFLGESIGVDITRVGEQDGQGIGHLPDGTMVVIDGGAEKMGSHANGTVSNILQTAGGRIIFAKIDPPLSGSTESMTAKAVGQPREIQSGGNPQTTTDQTRRSNPPSARNPRRT
jgi:hypothetical protein